MTRFTGWFGGSPGSFRSGVSPARFSMWHLAFFEFCARFTPLCRPLAVCISGASRLGSAVCHCERNANERDGWTAFFGLVPEVRPLPEGNFRALILSKSRIQGLSMRQSGLSGLPVNVEIFGFLRPFFCPRPGGGRITSMSERGYFQVST